MQQPLFSILIAQYNNGKYFKDCYDSIVAQTYSNWEVIIVDDSSADNSVAVMKKMIGDDSRFKMYSNEENKGCGYTKRRCAEIAVGEICAFLDPDDAITPEALELMIKTHAGYPEASAVYSKPVFCDDNLKAVNEINSWQVENGNPDFFDTEGKIFHFLSFKKSFYVQTEGINPFLQRAVDKDLALKLYEAGDCIFIDKSLYKYRIHKDGISTTGNENKAYFWYWIAMIDAAKRRNINIEDLFIEQAMKPRREQALQKEIDSYNRSFIFKAFRKLGLFNI